MRKKMNFVELTRMQQSAVKAGFGNTCSATGEECACACPQGKCLTDVKAGDCSGPMPE